jgi:hypothetical protein
MVTVPAAAEAVNRPAAVMVPALADQVTPEAAAPVLLMVALHCDVPLIATVDGLHTTERAKFVEVVEEEEELLVLLPQDVMTNSSSGAMRQQARFFEYSFLIIDTSAYVRLREPRCSAERSARDIGIRCTRFPGSKRPVLIN